MAGSRAFARTHPPRICEDPRGWPCTERPSGARVQRATCPNIPQDARCCPQSRRLEDLPTQLPHERGIHRSVTIAPGNRTSVRSRCRCQSALEAFCSAASRLYAACPPPPNVSRCTPALRKACAPASPPRGGPGECGAPGPALPAGATRGPIRLSSGKERMAQSPKPPPMCLRRTLNCVTSAGGMCWR